ncbi:MULTISPECIES: ZIP family metal transporter [Halolamina]|uniref:Zinc transporter, ZIP family n=1 Tax=Halolamina pelagica TaxID=699431 RepID=A0A1I5M651_9EURY|nr:MULTISPECIES: ZIP family metal transporter [Halolamina]NHX35886.1 ZIP family metal transporter [Halolamina sp. R1-12]SFP05118.1 zinc transporter, ZIP family [Halolamina pelagica]
MDTEASTQSRRGERIVGAIGVLSLLGATGIAAVTGAWKPIQIGWVAFAAMVGGVAMALRTDQNRPGTLVWGSGLASGAMIVSVGLFLLPDALNHHLRFGGLGVATGVIVGFAGHAIGHRLSHIELPMDATVAQLTAHAAAAGAIIGIVYGNMPELGPLLGVAIVSHKGPAGYAAADRLARNGRSWLPILLPAAGVGVVAVLASAVSLPASGPLNGLVFGFATGVFLHVAMDFLPRCELGSEVHDALSVDDDAHAVLDRLRLHAVASTVLGGLVVVALWWTVAP